MNYELAILLDRSCSRLESLHVIQARFWKLRPAADALRKMRFSGSKVLIVDDDPIWLAVMAKAARGCDMHVATATTLRAGAAALVSALDVLICEVLLRHETCFPLLEAARRGTTARVIAVSGRAPRPVVFRLHEFGVGTYLEKPFTAGALRACIEALPEPESRAYGPRPRYRTLVPTSGIEAVLDRVRDQYRFTGAELDVLRCALQGLNQRETAAQRARSINTVKTLVRSLLNKSGAPTLRVLVKSVQALSDAHTDDHAETIIADC